MLCDVCLAIHFKPFSQLTREEKICLATYEEEWPPEEWDEDQVLSGDHVLVGLESYLYCFHHPSLESLQKAADGGCHFCYQILYELLADKGKSSQHDFEDDCGRLYFTLSSEDSSSFEFEQNWYGALSVSLGTDILGHWRLRNKHSEWPVVCQPYKFALTLFVSL
jgi:hypothetical protein